MSSILGTYARKNISFEYGKGSYLFTKNGDKYLDFVQGIAVNALGHCHEHLVRAIQQQSKKLWHISNAFVIETQEKLAKKLTDNTFADFVCFQNSGTEATLNAIRAARAYTGKQKLAKFEGAYHGNHDAVQISVTPPLDLAGPASSPNSVRAFEGISNKAENDIVIRL